MRLDLFLPFRRGAEQGPLRRWLAAIGPTWSASPVRRLVQSGCFVAFLWLFLYVCWPYTARPARIWNGWLPAEVDETGGEVIAVSEHPPAEVPARHTVLHVVDASGEEPQYLGPFRVTDTSQQRLVLEPVEPPTDQRLDELLTSFGPWSLHEAEPGRWPSHYADNLQAKEKAAAEAFLAIDPLVGISTAVAAKCWVWSLGCAGVILLICLAVPRGFCSYVCPMGTLIDLFDWAIGKRVNRLRLAAGGWWVHVKYYLLLATLIASLFGVLISGFVAAIPVVTRGMAFLLTPLQTAAERGWHQVPPIGAGGTLSIVLFLAVMGLGLLGTRFWCKYVCPSGAVFSIGNLFRLSQRKVESSCIRCNRCLEICPFDAVKRDYTTRTADCTFCQACGGACPVRAIKFVSRFNNADLKPVGDPPTGETRVGRRGFLANTIGIAAGVVGGIGGAAAVRASGAPLDGPDALRPVRPPGSVPESKFLQLCIRCGECYQACPNDVLQPQGFRQGLQGLWTPQVAADWSGCEPSCNNCGQVCPTGAIRALPLQEKRVARMGLAVVDQQTCLPYAGREACQLCVDECAAAGYHAIEFVHVGTEVDGLGKPIEGTGWLAPVVLPEKCIGCGLCQTRCFAVNARQKRLLKETAVRVEAGDGKEDRLTSGSYVELRRQELRRRKQQQRKQLKQSGGEGGYLPDFLDRP